MKGNVNNLVTFCLDQMLRRSAGLRRSIEQSPGRLEKETLIRQDGDDCLVPAFDAAFDRTLTQQGPSLFHNLPKKCGEHPEKKTTPPGNKSHGDVF